ncbi:MAG: hypothetical protein ACFCUL_15590 [Flavobacteriaceae bacterium]
MDTNKHLPFWVNLHVLFSATTMALAQWLSILDKIVKPVKKVSPIFFWTFVKMLAIGDHFNPFQMLSPQKNKSLPIIRLAEI